MIRIEQATIAPGGNDLIVDATWHIRPKDRVGLVGRNGTGKTSLIRTVLGELLLDSGKIHQRSGLTIGYLPQHAVSGSTATVWTEVQSNMHAYHDLKTALEQAEKSVAEGQDGSHEKLEEITERFRLADGFAMEAKIGSVLSGLGFQTEDWHRACDEFSGGWQMRIALARLLLSSPDLAILDEPTNHLDILARTWLAQFLASASFGTVIVSHDRHLMDKVCTRIVEIRHKRLHLYTGNYTQFLTERELRLSQTASAYEKQQDKIAHMEGFNERFGAKATKAKQAQSRKKQLEKLERIEAPTSLGPRPRLKLPEAPASDTAVLELKDAQLGWTPGDPVLEGVSLRLERGMRVGVLGANGCGKTTLLRSLWGKLPLLKGLRKPGQRIRIGVFTQDLAAELPTDETPLEWISGQASMTPPERIRSILGALGLPGDMALRDIGQLSGGERARVALAAIASRPYNVLLLDEPTNHLDTETIDALIEGLRGFEGTLILVSHDRYFVESLASHVLILHNAAASFREEVRAEDFQLQPRVRKKGKDDSNKASYEERKKAQRERERTARRIKEIESLVPKLEAEMAPVNTALCEVGTDYEKAQRLGDELKALEDKVEQLYDEWAELEETLAENEQ